MRPIGIRTEDLLLAAAPRMLVDPEAIGGCLLWPLLFVLYLVSAALGIGWLAAVAG